MDAELIPNANVEIGDARFGNHLPLALIAGPCALEGRTHALETASALKEIAGRLEISIDTVRRHCHNIYGKMHVASRTEAVVRFLEG